MIHVTLASSSDGDWKAVYINGRLAEGVEQNHSLQMHDVINAVLDAAQRFGGVDNYSITHIEADMEEGMAAWLGDRGFPEYLGQIPQEARS